MMSTMSDEIRKKKTERIIRASDFSKKGRSWKNRDGRIKNFIDTKNKPKINDEEKKPL